MNRGKRRDLKRKRYQIRKIYKAMRYLNKRNKKIHIFRNNKSSDEDKVSLEVFNFLNSSKGFDKGRSHPNVNKKVILKLPKVFSISYNPDESLELLGELFSKVKNKNIEMIEFDHAPCEKLGLDASTVMDVILFSLKAKKKEQKVDFNFGGNFINIKRNVLDVLRTSGMFKHFDIDLPVCRTDKKIRPFQLIRNRHNSKVSDITGTELTKYFNHCLETQGFELTEKGKGKFSQMIGEVVNNCELHGGKGSVWHTIGHYQMSNDTEYGELQLVFFDFGNTMFQALESEDSSEETKEKFARLCVIHEKFFSKSWTKEMLATVFLLQAKVSRLRDKDSKENRDRGTGTIRLIDGFMDIGCTKDGKKPIMTITSGNTHIVFSERYKLQRKNIEGDVLGNGYTKTIAFNSDNDICKPSDSMAVKRLKTFFPGTLISMSFFLEKGYIKEVIK